MMVVCIYKSADGPHDSARWYMVSTAMPSGPKGPHQGQSTCVNEGEGRKGTLKA